MTMKTNHVFSPFVAGLIACAALVPAASAAPDFNRHSTSAASCPTVVPVADQRNVRANDAMLQTGSKPDEPRMGAYGPDWYAKQRQLQRKADPRLPSAPQGHWKQDVVRDVIPAHWEVVGYDSQGRAIQNYQSEHVEFRTARVWVEDR